MYYDPELTNSHYEQRQRELARAYGDSQADAAMLRAFVGNAVSGLGTMLIRIGQLLDSSSIQHRGQQFEPLRVQTQNGK